MASQFMRMPECVDTIRSIRGWDHFSIRMLLACGLVFGLASCTSEVDNGNTDRDNDGLSNEFEVRIGTDPDSADTDRDGLPDGYELFTVTGSEINENLAVDELRDQENDGLHSAIDSDDNGDGIHDGLEDHDNDGIPNSYEYYGFHYDAENGFQPRVDVTLPEDQQRKTDDSFDPFDLGSWQTYFKTDPTVASTDRDPYDDYMEITGADKDGTLMDTSVAPPGNHPLIPAYPDIYLEVQGINITLNADISSSSSHLQANSWSETTVSEDKTVTDWNSTAKTSVDVGMSGFSAHAEATTSKDTTHTVDNTVTSFHSGFSQSQWSSAISTNTLQTATMTLTSTLVNMGTAVAKNIVPTVTVSIGGTPIGTYTLGTTVSMLTSDGFTGSTSSTLVLPEQGAPSSSTLWLSIDELRSLETGAALTVEMAEVDASVLGSGEASTDWADYKAQIIGACAKMSVDLGDGNVSSYYVWAPQHPAWQKPASGPPVTILEAILWVTMGEMTANGLEIPLPDGTTLTTNMDGWRFGLDDRTYNEQVANQQDLNIWNVLLYADAEVIAKAPPQGDLVNPQIFWTTMSATAPVVISSFVQDYFAVESVYFYPTSSATQSDAQEMTDTDGDGIYTVNLGSSYTVSGTEQIVATNDTGHTTTALQNFLPAPDSEHVSATKQITIQIDDTAYTLEERQAGKTWAYSGTLSIGGYDREHDVFNLTATYSPNCRDCYTCCSAKLGYEHTKLAELVNASKLGTLSADEFNAIHLSDIKALTFDQIGGQEDYGSPVSIPLGTSWALSFEDGHYAKIRYHSINNASTSESDYVCDDGCWYDAYQLVFDTAVYQVE